MIASVSVYEQIGGGKQPERLVEKRRITLASDEPLNGKRARELLAREFPELGRLHSALKKRDAWWTMKAVRSEETSSPHYVWRHYYVTTE